MSEFRENKFKAKENNQKRQKRIITRNGYKFYKRVDYSDTSGWPSVDWLLDDNDSRSPTPLTKKEYDDITRNNGLQDSAKEIIDFVGSEEFWQRYSKPILVIKMYKIFVPKTADLIFYKAENSIGVDTGLDVCGSNYENAAVLFTKAEIKKYGLESYKRVLAIPDV